ncbi:MAG TPA: alpha-amylase family glycosyl hydrolase, partial [Kofleriaceae bacterium]
MRTVVSLGTLILAGSCGRAPSPIEPTADAGIADARPRPPAPDMGANVTEHGVTFRVWAPHARAAYVAGDFTDAPLAMVATTDGVFELDSAAAHVGSIYHYELDTDNGMLRRVDPYCRELMTKAPDCMVEDPYAYAWHDDGFVAPDRAHSIVYELHIGSFTNAGTFTAARERLAELHELGVTTIELMPVNAFGGGDRSWGYNPQLYLAPKHSYGSADELRAFVDEAHRQGIAVWVDFVVNHSDGYRGAPLVCYDGYCPNNAWGIHFFPPGTYATTPWGPRPNYSDPHVATMLRDAVSQWLGEFHGDGFRWDSVSNIRALDGNGTTPGGRELLVAANDLTHQYGSLSIAEDLKGYGAITQPTSA